MRTFPAKIFLRAISLSGVFLLIFLWRAAAQEASQILIDNVDASAFPTVLIDLSVADDLGVPLPQLTAADFQVFEDGNKVPASSITLEPAENQPIGLVFAVDLSTEVTDLEEIKSGLRTLVGRMGVGDQGALLTFADGVQVAQTATANPNELLTAIDRLQVAGNYTSLNRATVEAMNRAELLSAKRKAVVVVTDSVENINSLPLADVYSRADQVEIPIYLFAYSPKSQPASAMEAFGLRIKAKPYVADTATGARLRLLTLGSLFERGYRLRYISALAADGSEHSVSVNLVGGGSVGGSTSRGPLSSRVTLVAQPGVIDVALPALSDGQTVGGVVDLRPTISGPGPIRSVDYLIDGRVAASLLQAPFTWAWDTGTLIEGSHVVGLRAVDSAGNRGEKYVTVNVADPLLIQATVDRSRGYVGDEVFVTVQVDALAGVGAVDLLVDGTPLARRTEPPFVFPLNSSSYAQGEHTISVPASARNGYIKSTKFSLHLLPPAPRFIFTGQTWLRIAALLSIVLALILAWLLLVWLAQMARRRRRRRFSLALDNLGNIASAYLVRADDPKGALAFHLLHQGLKLAGRTVRDWVPLTQEEWENLQFRAQTVQMEQAEAAYAAATPLPAASAQPGQSLTGGVSAARENVGAGLGRAKAGAGAGLAKLKNVGKNTSRAGEVAGAGASLLYALGGFLPASMGGAALRRAGQGSMSAYRGVRSVERVQRQAGQIQNATSGPQVSLTAAQRRDMERAQGAGFGTANMEEILEKGQKQAASAPAPTVALADPMPAPVNGKGQAGGTALVPGAGPRRAVGSNGHGPYGGVSSLPPAMPDLRYDANGVPFKRVTRKIDDTWTETPGVEPGDSLFLELVIEPNHPRRGQSYPFRIVSKSIDAEDQPLVIHEAVVEIRGRSWLSWLLAPVLIGAATAAFVLFMLAFLLTDLGLL